MSPQVGFCHPKPPSNRARKKKTKGRVNFSFVSQLTVQEGLDLMNHVLTNMRGEDKLYVSGFNVKRDFDRFAALTSCELKCFRCGVEATHFIIERHKNNVGWPYNLNVYAGNKMLTWDHILPKSHGGSNDPINARCACSKCNETRGSDMTLREMVWAVTQNPLKIYKYPPILKTTIREIVGLVRAENRMGILSDNVS